MNLLVAAVTTNKRSYPSADGEFGANSQWRFLSMTVKFSKGSAASEGDITALERSLGEALPAAFIDFIRQNDGAEPETNIFKIGTKNESGVNGFIPVRKIIREKNHIENLPQGAFPIAWAEGGNYVLVNLRMGGAVYFWDHEQPTKTVMLAENFSSFLSLLEPFDVSSIKLKPGQVKGAWIDPDFLKNLK